MRKNKKGISIDFIYMIIMLVVFALFIIMGKVLFDSVNTEMQAGDLLTNESKENIQDINDRYVAIFDYGFLFILVGLFIFLLVSAYHLDTSPVYFILATIFFIIAFVIGGILNNVFYDFATSDAMAVTANSFTIIPYVMNNLLSILAIIAISTMVIMYAGKQTH